MKSEDSNKKSNIKTMDVILIIIAISLFIFTITMIGIFKECGSVPDTLITCVFAALGGECGIMGWIKTNKDRNRARKQELEDREYYNNSNAQTDKE